MSSNDHPSKPELHSKNVDSKIPTWISNEYFESICAESVKNFSKITKITAEPGSAVGENYASIILRVLIECELQG